MDAYISNVLIVGVGLIGGSLGKALKCSPLKCWIIGFEQSEEKVKQAIEYGAIDWGTGNWKEVLKAVDKTLGRTLIVFAAPVETNLRLFDDFWCLRKEPWFANNGYVISDVGSVKTGFAVHCKQAIETRDFTFPLKQVLFCPAHPIAGREKSGAMYADPNLFREKVVVLTPWTTKEERLVPLNYGAKTVLPSSNVSNVFYPETDSRDKTQKLVVSDYDWTSIPCIEGLNLVRDVWTSIGARVIVTSAEEHDQILARTSHLPNLVSALTTSVVPYEEYIFAGTGFRDTTRLASGSPEVWTEIFGANRVATLEALGRLEEQILRWKVFLQQDDRRAILTFLQETKKKRDALGS